MIKYEETGTYPKGQFDGYHSIMLKARNRDWTCKRLADYLNSAYSESFSERSVANFCSMAFRFTDSYSPICYNPDDNPKWTNSGLQLLKAAS